MMNEEAKGLSTRPATLLAAHLLAMRATYVVTRSQGAADSPLALFTVQAAAAGKKKRFGRNRGAPSNDIHDGNAPSVTWIKSSLPLSLLSPTKLCCTHSLVYCHVVLDTGANASLFHNKKLLSNLCPTRHPITVNGIGGNSITVSQVGDFGAFGEVYYSPSSIANALSERLPIQINTTKAGVHYTRQCPSIVKSVSSLATSRITMYWCRRCRSAKLSIRNDKLQTRRRHEHCRRT